MTNYISKRAVVNGVNLHYVVAGEGPGALPARLASELVNVGLYIADMDAALACVSGAGWMRVAEPQTV